MNAITKNVNFLSINFINKTIQILLLFLFLVNVGVSLYAPIIAVYVTGHIVGATLATVGVTIAIYSVTKSVVQVPVARRLDLKVGETDDLVVLLLGSLLGVVYPFSFLFISEIWQLYILQIVSGIGDGLLLAAYYAIFSHHIDRHSEGFEWSLLSVGGLTASAAVGGLLGGFVAENYGFQSVFIGAGLLNLAGAVLLLVFFPYVKILRSKTHFKTVIHSRRS